MLQRGKINFLIGISFGSEGKGNISDYLGQKYEFELAISNNSPNAGHQWRDDNDVVQTAKMLPVCGIVNRKSSVMLGAGSVIDVARLNEEMTKHNCSDRIVISSTAPIVDEYCREYERENLKYIASTFQGTGAAIGLKAMRSPRIKLARDIEELNKYCTKEFGDVIIDKVKNNKQTALCEICQGYGLSIDSNHYPFVTSRCVNVGQSLAYLDIPHDMIGNVIGIARSYIIRVGNVDGGTSGPTFSDSKELTWDEMSQKLGRNVLEMTTVTKRVRRVFTFSKQMFEMGVRRNGVNIVFISFCDYLTKKEQLDFADYLIDRNKFDFKQIYFVHGFGSHDKNIERIK